MGGGCRAAVRAASTAFAALRRRRRLLPPATLMQQRRHCSGSFAAGKQAFHYRPHQLSGKSRRGANSGAEASLAAPASSSMRLSLDSLAPPATLTADTAVEYLAALRGLHRSLGIATSSSRVRWQAREFLLRGMPDPNAKELQALWTMTEELACAITVSCAYFEVSISECMYGTESVEFLQGIWQKRLQASSASSSVLKCTCEEAVLLGRLTMALLELLTNRILHVEVDEYELLSQLLCMTLLPAVMSVLQDDALFHSSTGGADENTSELTAAQATAFTVLLSSLTKAAVTQWARPGSDSGGVVLFGTPAAPPRPPEGVPRLPRALRVSVPALPLAKLARGVHHCARGLLPAQVKEAALPLLRFFTLTQCVPLFIVPCGACVQHGGDDGGGAQDTHMVSLVTSITDVLQASLEHRTAFVSHQVANITSIYARILSFSPRDPAREAGTDGNVATASAQWLMFESLMMGVKRNLLYHVEPLSPTVVMPQLCECVTAFARKYLFSDLAALLNALSKIFRVVCEHHRRLRAQPQQWRQSQGAQLDRQDAVRSRFERRRTTAPVATTSEVSTDAGHSSPSSAAAAPPPSSSSTGVFFVSNDDIAEIEGELEVLLDACVAVMERHLPASCNSRQVFVAKASAPHSAGREGGGGGGGSTAGREETGVALAGVGASQAKSLGGRSRRLKKTVSSRELVMIAEGVHALSWRPFMAFQERLLTLLSSHVGQMEATPSEYACLVGYLLRAPPVPPSVIFHSVGDRLRRLIHAEAVTAASSHGVGLGGSQASTAAVATAEEEEGGGGRMVIAAAHARSLQDKPLALHDACAVVFAFAQKLKKSALPLLHDLLVRCGQRVVAASGSPPGLCEDAATFFSAFAMFVASATWVLHQSEPFSAGDHVLAFIATSRDRAAQVLAAMAPEEGSHAATARLPLRELAYACMMLEPSRGSGGDGPLAQLRRGLREAYTVCGSRCDSMEVAQFLADYLATTAMTMSYGDSLTAREGAAPPQLLPWMIASLQLQQRLASSTRILIVTFSPFLAGGSDEEVARILHVTRMYCRTFATLVTTLRLLRAAKVELLREEAVLAVVLRKVAQLTRRTARPLELFQFFELYGDCPQLVAACLSELLPEAQCFNAINAFVPIVQVNAAVRAVRRLRQRELRQRWLAAMTPLILSAVSSSREPLDVVLELTECIGSDDPGLLQAVLKSSASMQVIHETFSYTVPGDVLLRLLLQLQSVKTSHPTVRRLHAASRKLLQRGNVHIPLEQLAQAMLLPSLEGTTLGRRLQKLFVFRVTTLLGATRPRSARRKELPEAKCDEDPPTTAERHFHWDESLNRLELEHWMALLRFSHVGEPSSHRLVMAIKQDRDATAQRRGKSAFSASANGENAPATAEAAAAAAAAADVPAGETPEGHAGSSEVGERADKRCRSLAYFYAFSDHTILCLRRALGAFHFITLVCELLRQAACLSPEAASAQEPASRGRRCMYDGSASPLSDARVWPFLRLAVGLVEEMSADLGEFLRREQDERRRLHYREEAAAAAGGVEEGAEVVLNVGAVLELLRLLDAYDPPLREQRLLLHLQLPPSSPAPAEAPALFADAVQLPHRHLYRLLLQLPLYWGKETPAATPVDTPRVRLQNISSVFDYCSAPPEFDSPFGAPDPSMEAHRRLTGIFGTDRPLITDVWLPLPALRSQQQQIDRSVKTQLFEALMRCLVRDGESLAATRSRLAALGPRDLACVAQTCLRGDTGDAVGTDARDRWGEDSWRRGRRAEAVTALELLTDMLPSATAEDIHDVVMVLLPPPSAEARRHGGDGHASHAPPHGEVAEVRRFLAHVAVVMGNDTERFPLPLLYGILLRLHEPHRLIAPAAAQMMLTSLHVADDATRRQHPQEHEEEAAAVEEEGPEEAVDGPSRKRCYTAAVALLRSVVASSSSASSCA
ncbi:uncharacterized protein Tco025E_04045 [Trypanosoma conorhini]|uniref:Uncharacterized protein n=1 Tax=Trypanosoma conorhini TaxID=83891 RepID=A0A422PPG0_9TRYP|nr:uncharacterized protein Tco025E_04045 [Trypanosoma conorhini]RNF19633.1 hypothetical protein Tco025E_04045 [Trypanosoma conorhini]